MAKWNCTKAPISSPVEPRFTEGPASCIAGGSDVLDNCSIVILNFLHAFNHGLGMAVKLPECHSNSIRINIVNHIPITKDDYNTSSSSG